MHGCSSLARSCLTFCDPMDCSMPGFPVCHSIPEFAQIHALWVSMLSKYLLLCCPQIVLPLIFPSSKVFSNELALFIRWLKDWRFSFSPSNGYSGLVSFRINWFDLLIIQGTSDVAAIRRRCIYFCDIRQSHKLGSMSHNQSSEAHTVWSGCNEAQLLSVFVSLYPRFTI